jgi:hypothetical protein
LISPLNRLAGNFFFVRVCFVIFTASIGGLPGNEQFLVTSVRLQFSDAQRVSPAQAAEFLKQNLGIDLTSGHERYDAKQNVLEYAW